MIGRTLAHYRITAAIGAGGMGEVYRATDTKLGRDVALKVLPAEMAADPERLERFQREARVVAALNHPHIVTIHAVEEAEGVHFLTMELVEGQPLDRLIPAAGLPVERILAIATALTEALAAAHEKGIVHRDLKPGNVMLTTQGRVKVLDFGLAKLTGPRSGGAGESQLPTDVRTREGVVMGTVPYMSPEQVQGRPVDARTDIFSLGVILYEMATGRRPFHSDSTAGLVSAILRDAPEPPIALRAGLPETLQGVIARCLAKDPAARFQSAREVQAALEGKGSVDSGSAAPVARSPARSGSQQRSDSSPDRSEVPWIAVLPLKTQGADPELAAFGDGLGEDITTGLSRFSHLFVISRQSALQYAGRSLDVRTVGRELGARYALEGAVRKAGSAVRVSVQLLDASTGTHLWAEAYDRDLAAAGIFAIQDEITDRVVATVADPYGVLVRSMALAVRDERLEELSATELVLRFFAYWHQIRPDEHARLRTVLERKLEREPAHADAWACLSRLYSHEHQHRVNPLPDSIERARKAARRAVEIDPTCQMGWEALADASYFARDLGTFRSAAERAMSLNARNTNTVATMAMLIAFGGEWDRGVEITRRAMALNPHHPGWYHFAPFYGHYRKGEYEQALETTKRINMPEFFWTHFVSAAVCGRLGRQEDARTALGALRRSFPDYQEQVRPNVALWIADADVVQQVMQGLAEAEALVAASPSPAPLPVDVPAPPRPASAERKAIAILPLANLSAEADNEFFSDGMTEDILARVSTVKDLRVISRTSVMVYKKTTKSIRDIARELDVGWVLEGSVRRVGNKVRIVAQLIEAATDKHLWAGTYDRQLDDVFAIQSDVAENIAAALQAKLAPEVVERMRRRPTEQMDAYDLFLRGRQNIWTLEAVRLAEGVAQLERAIELDPGFAAAHAMLAIERVLACYWAGAVGREELPRGMASAQRALELDETCALAWVARGTIRYHYQWDWEGAERDLKRALALDPNEALAHFWLSVLYFVCERFDDGLAAAEAGAKLDPHSAFPFTQVAYCKWLLGRDAEAEETLASAIERHPSDFNLHNVMGVLLRRAGRFDDAARHFASAGRLTGGHPFLKASEALCLRLAGDREGASRLLAEVAGNPDDSRINSDTEMMLTVARSGNARQWLTELGAALDRRSVMAPWFIRVVWESVGDPPQIYAPENYQPLSRQHPDVLAVLRRLWPGDFPAP